MIFTVIIAILSVKLIIDHRKNKFVLLTLILFVIVTLLVSISIFINYKFDYFNQMSLMILTVNTAYISGFCIVKYDAYKNFESNIEKISLITIPTLFVYAWMTVTGSNPSENSVNLGIVNYMVIANATLPIIIAYSISFIRGGSKKIFGIIGNKYADFAHLTLIIILWYCVIIPSGTRGSILSYIGFCLFITVGQIYLRKKVLKSIGLSVVMIVLFIVQLYVPINQASANRMLDFTEGLFTEGSLQTSNNVEELSQTEIDTAVSIDINYLREIGYDDSYIEEAKQLGAEIDQDLLIFEKVRNNIGSRGALFSVALSEGIENPLDGLGPMGYTYKYGMYPHNAALELISDFGIVWGGLACLGILLVVVKMIVYAKKDENLLYVMIFVSGFFVSIMASGTLYTCIPLFFSLGISFAYMINKNDKLAKISGDDKAK